MEITLANGSTYTCYGTGSTGTRVEPSGNPAVRSRLFVYLPEDTMPLKEFVVVFTDEDNLQTITLRGDTYENTYTHYTVAQSVGKELVTKVDSQTGATVQEYCLVARLEQLTYIEQQLKALGLL